MLSSLFIGIKKKRGSLYLLLVPRSEALALPIEVERATQKPTPNMLYCITAHTAMTNIHIPHRTSTVASSLTSILNLLDSRTSRTKRQVNAFPYVMCSLPYTHPLEWTSAKEQPQIYTLFHFEAHFYRFFSSKSV